MRKPFIAGNWKMHHILGTAQLEVEKLHKAVAGITGIDIAVCPPFIFLDRLAKILAGSNIMLGAQNVFWEEKGAFTGEISPGMIKDAGCKWVIIGHSERRQYFGETDETVSKRIAAALNAGLNVIMCCGESLQQREAGEMEKVVRQQLDGGLQGLKNDDMKKIVIAYEPVWAIGTGKTATVQQAQDMHAFIRGWLVKAFGAEIGQATRIQYGGSVKPDNIGELMSAPDIDGALVGGASLTADSFSQIIINSNKN